jgi:hypothetical protein
MDEQTATDKLERLVGSPDRCFRLMRLYQSAQQSASGNRFTLRKMPSVEDIFRRKARTATAAAISHYLRHVR